uniref:Uncharacterized protein n=1 Tax=Glossina pallidipes TaxID=7398 RepID=A0A1A9ZAI0_GLOPL
MYERMGQDVRNKNILLDSSGVATPIGERSKVGREVCRVTTLTYLVFPQSSFLSVLRVGDKIAKNHLNTETIVKSVDSDDDQNLLQMCPSSQELVTSEHIARLRNVFATNDDNEAH